MIKKTVDLPLVSIVTPSFNQGNFLEATIRSVLEQTYPRIEYLVIDGGSTDESISIIQRYADRLDYWETELDRGQAHAVNKGIKHSHGSILGWLNSDDVLLHDSIATAVDVFQNDPEVDVVYGRLERIDEEGNILPTPELPKDLVVFSKELVVGECVVNQPGCLWRREIMERAGLLNEELKFAMDYEFWIRMALAGACFRRLPRVVAQFRLSRGSKTVAHSSSQAVEQLQVLESFSTSPDLPEKIGKTREEIQALARRTRARFYLQGFYGEFKQHHWISSTVWLGKAIRNDPISVFERRWINLGIASLRRQSRR